MRVETSKTKQEYLKRIVRVINYIEKNLDNDLHLEGLSQKAFYSSFHFHRIFSALVGETVNSFIVRKRLERIASIIAVGSNEPFVDLAFRYGFSNAASFSRAFKKFYGISPVEFKKEGHLKFSKIGKVTISTEDYLCNKIYTFNWLKMNAKIEVKELPEVKLAGIMHIGKPDQINTAYERLFKWAFSKGLHNSPGFKALTLYHDHPGITGTAKLRQSACVTVDGPFSVDGEVLNLVIEKGWFVIGHFELKSSQFQKTWEDLCVWVIEHGYSFRDGDYFEVFHNDSKTHPQHKWIVDICIPIEAGISRKPRAEKNTPPLNENWKDYQHQLETGTVASTYQGLMGFMRNLRTYFINNYPVGYAIGSLYSGDRPISFFPFTPETLKKKKLKIVIVFNHKEMRFEVWLAGQNKQIQKEYWEIFKGSDWNPYHIPSSIENGFSIVDHVLVEYPDFENAKALIGQIESQTLEFIQEIEKVLV